MVNKVDKGNTREKLENWKELRRKAGKDLKSSREAWRGRIRGNYCFSGALGLS